MPNDVEEKAVRIVVKYEKNEGRDACDVRKNIPKTGVDVVSLGRYIEVKGSTAEILSGVNMGVYNLDAAKNYTDKYWLYIVYGIPKKPKLLMFKYNDIPDQNKESHTSCYIKVGKNEREKSIDVSKLAHQG